MPNCTEESCESAPIPEGCGHYCVQHMLKQTTREELELILGLSKELAETIYNAYHGPFAINNFEDLHLTALQANEVVEKVMSLNQYQLDYFNTGRSLRRDVIYAIKLLDINKDKIQVTGAENVFADTVIVDPFERKKINQLRVDLEKVHPDKIHLYKMEVDKIYLKKIYPKEL
jgi:hypothetical protein